MWSSRRSSPGRVPRESPWPTARSSACCRSTCWSRRPASTSRPESWRRPRSSRRDCCKHSAVRSRCRAPELGSLRQVQRRISTPGGQASVEDGRRERHEPRELPADDLRADVRYLGSLLGTVLREQGGDELLAAVEQARVTAIELREAGDDDLGPLLRVVGDLDPELAPSVV